mmetsp:Transcript_92926/g.277317  ORF Transcript_92926/g.277317 Transcript_92926/m.277317 type:complete len:446 (+) Transcript_92926:63-1400(+)
MGYVRTSAAPCLNSQYTASNDPSKGASPRCRRTTLPAKAIARGLAIPHPSPPMLGLSSRNKSAWTSVSTPTAPSSASSALAQPSAPRRSKTSTCGAPSTRAAMRWWVRGQTATSTTACRPPSSAAWPPGVRSWGTGSTRDIGSKPKASPLPLPPPTPLTSKSWPPAAPISVSLLHQATEGPALGAGRPRPMSRLTSQVCVFHRRTKCALPAWATASVEPSGPHCRSVTGPLLHRRSVTHHGIGCSEERPLWGHTRTIPCAAAAARHRPSGDQVTAGQAKASPRSDQAHRQPSGSACRHTARPADMPTARDPRMLLGCHAMRSGNPWLPSACRYCVLLAEKASPMECTARVPLGDRVAKTSRWGCHATAGEGPPPCGMRPAPAAPAPNTRLQMAATTSKIKQSTQCSNAIHPGRVCCPMSFSRNAPARPHRCQTPRGPQSSCSAAP